MHLALLTIATFWKKRMINLPSRLAPYEVGKTMSSLSSRWVYALCLSCQALNVNYVQDNMGLNETDGGMFIVNTRRGILTDGTFI